MTENVHAWFGGGRLETQVKLCAGRLPNWIVLCETERQARRSWRDAGRILSEIRLQFEPTKTRLTCFDEGFDYLGVTFYRDRYSYTHQNKRIEVAGPFDGWLFARTGPEGYQE